MATFFGTPRRILVTIILVIWAIPVMVYVVIPLLTVLLGQLLAVAILIAIIMWLLGIRPGRRHER
jgi:hypothetical protein